MKKENIKRQFEDMAKGINSETLLEVCDGLVSEYRGLELGYGRRCSLENESGDVRKIRSWVDGKFFGFGTGPRITFIEETVLVEQGSSVK